MYSEQKNDIPPIRNTTIKNCSKVAGTTNTCDQDYASIQLLFVEVDKSNDNENGESQTIKDEPDMKLIFVIVITNMYLFFKKSIQMKMMMMLITNMT